MKIGSFQTLVKETGTCNHCSTAFQTARASAAGGIPRGVRALQSTTPANPSSRPFTFSDSESSNQTCRRPSGLCFVSVYSKGTLNLVLCPAPGCTSTLQFASRRSCRDRPATRPRQQSAPRCMPQLCLLRCKGKRTRITVGRAGSLLPAHPRTGTYISHTLLWYMKHSKLVKTVAHVSETKAVAADHSCSPL